MHLSPNKPGSVRISPSKIKGARTSDPSSRIGVSKVTAEIQDKYDKLKADFAQIDTNGDHRLSFDEVYNFFNEKSQKETGKDFDVALAKELFNKLDKNQDNQVTIDEIVLSYVDAENLIFKDIDTKRKEIAEDMQLLEEVKRKKIEFGASETYNAENISIDSMLTVNVIEA